MSITLPQITKLKFSSLEIEKKGLKWEQQVGQLKEEVQTVETAMGKLEQDVGPGSKKATHTKIKKPKLDPDDPNKNQFGGTPNANGRELSAEIEPDAGPKSRRCQVTITIKSTNTSNPLKGKVKVFLHPSYEEWESYDLPVKGGIATDTFESYGVFTIGVIADDGETKLELDLMDVPGGTKAFYNS